MTQQTQQMSAEFETAILRLEATKVAQLIEEGHDPNAITSSGDTALDAVIRRVAMTPKDLAFNVIKGLLDKGADISLGAPLHTIVSTAQFMSDKAVAVEIFEFLVERGADVHARDQDGLTPLQAIRDPAQDKEMVIALVKARANPHEETDEGGNPLYDSYPTELKQEVDKILFDAQNHIDKVGEDVDNVGGSLQEHDQALVKHPGVDEIDPA